MAEPTSDRASSDDERGLIRRWMPSSVRGRSTLLATIIVATTLALGAALLLAVYRNQVQSNLDVTLEQQVADRVRLLEGGSDPTSLITVLEEEAMVWIGGTDGRPLAVGGSMVPLGDPRPPVIGRTETYPILVNEVSPGEVEREVADMRVASGLTADGRFLVLAGAEAEVVTNDVAVVGRLFAVGLPPVVALVAALTWFTAGRALRPVEDIRARASAISGSNLGDRVPVPDGHDEIRELALTMNAMLSSIESHEYSLRQFTADASHELKSPVANLRALLDTVGVDDPRWPELRRRLTGETDRLGDLVSNLLYLASSQAGRPSGQIEAVALDELLFDEAEVLAATGTLTVDLGQVEPAVIDGVRNELSRLVRNLVDNAARHAQSRVAFGIEHGPGGEVTVVIGDDGPGIDPDDRAKVFERFTRLDDARSRDVGGAGLGLAIVKQIAGNGGGEVTIGRSPLGGAEFRVTVPPRGGRPEPGH